MSEDRTAALVYSLRSKDAVNVKTNAEIECARLAEQRGYHVAGMYSDSGRPWSLERRGLQLLIEKAAELLGGNVVVIVRDWRQLAERTEDQLALLDMLEYLGIDVEVANPAGHPRERRSPRWSSSRGRSRGQAKRPA